jgi:hypothetical protein
MMRCWQRVSITPSEQCRVMKSYIPYTSAHGNHHLNLQVTKVVKSGKANTKLHFTQKSNYNEGQILTLSSPLVNLCRGPVFTTCNIPKQEQNPEPQHLKAHEFEHSESLNPLHDPPQIRVDMDQGLSFLRLSLLAIKTHCFDNHILYVATNCI